MSTLENCLISKYLLWFSTKVQIEKNWGDTPSATLKTQEYWSTNVYKMATSCDGQIIATQPEVKLF